MRKSATRAAVLCTALFMILAARGVGAQDPINENGDFEDSDVGQESGIAGWFLQLDGDAQANFVIVDDPVQSGSRALSIEVISISTQDERWHIQPVNQGIPVHETGPGTYTYSGWVRGETDGGSIVMGIDLDQAGGFATAEQDSVEVTEEWQEVTFEFEVPEEIDGDAPQTIRAFHALSLEGNAGRTFYLDNIQVFPGTVTSSDDDGRNVPEQFVLHQNYPNPFNPGTQISYELSDMAHVTLTVYNTLGEEVMTLVNGQQTAGTHHVRFDAAELSSGVYVYRLEAGGHSETRRMMYIK